ncbi:hypothetical protein FOXG_19617 [Fusarium oxysporum f. sp. lycopersici 4287]|uniref:Uncharacterized protein n=1 Tax=Fusarium oxysporum f. sp. lycopersici (strain 4287 / CBS 123668 / FGSC 9935 / NRRL 34936) TaxID=426428 RepID=A0A0J9V4V6_FUSO4|nr:hypothetical protein FOXG_19617 [Fusarium oxysporum f. sp. lycopersici 4287]KNB06270.1 hypothetical protein FOXG_19617 [Fusarium oxysporum f. sp. lycopersici 4287]
MESSNHQLRDRNEGDSVSSARTQADRAFTEAVNAEISRRLGNLTQPTMRGRVPARGARHGASTCEKDREIQDLKEKLASAMEEVQFLRQQLDKFRKQ